MTKKLIIVMQNLEMGGAENVLISFLKNFDRSKYSVRLVLYTKEGVLLNEVPSDVQVSGIVPSRWGIVSKLLRGGYKGLLFYMPFLLKWINSFKYGNDSVVISFMEGISTHVAAYFNGPKIAWVHTDVINNPWGDRAFKSYKQQQTVYSEFDSLVFVSKSGLSAFKQKFDNVAVPKTIIHNVVDVDEILKRAKRVDASFSKWENDTAGRVRVVSVGRTVKVKRFDLLVSAFLNSKYRDKMTLTIVGDGAELKKLREQVSLAGASNVFFLGMKNNPIPYVKAADLFINSSLVESYPTVIAEALVVGTPVLATKNGGSEEILEDGKYGDLLENTVSVNDFSKRLDESVQSLERMTSKVTEAEGAFSVVNSLKEYDTLIDEIS